jgi:hypothetical protein
MMTIFEDIYEYIPENEEDDGHSNLIGGFLPEGVLNYLSARYFTKFPQSFTEMLNTSSRNSFVMIKATVNFS